ncbi:MAG TPA: DUF3775 domain-containing protein [Stellaceae bacterium]|nr:DUF3775 domain-containing protein [Stellaceae bacterium]
MAEDENEADGIELDVSVEKVCYIIIKAREFDAKVDAVEPDAGSNPGDDGERIVLEDYADDLTLQELRDAIDALNEDEAIDVIAMAWVGRGDFDVEEWEEARALASERHRLRSSAYLTGMPTLGDFLEEGLSLLGFSCEDFEIGRL